MNLVDDLTLRSYYYQRKWWGMTAMEASTIFKNADLLEAAYQELRSK